jgi:hypothetical protein
LRDKKVKHDDKDNRKERKKSHSKIEGTNMDKAIQKEEKHAEKVAATLKEAAKALNIEIQDIAGGVDKKTRHHNYDTKGDAALKLEHLSGKPRKGAPDQKKLEHERRKKMKENKRRNNDSKTNKPNRNSDMKVKLDNLEASKAEKERKRLRRGSLHDEQALKMKVATTSRNFSKGGKSRRL